MTPTNRQQRAQTRRPWHEQTVQRARARRCAGARRRCVALCRPSRWLRVCAACPHPHRTLEAPGVPICGLRVQFSEQVHLYRPNSDDRSAVRAVFPTAGFLEASTCCGPKAGVRGRPPKHLEPLKWFDMVALMSDVGHPAPEGTQCSPPPNPIRPVPALVSSLGAAPNAGSALVPGLPQGGALLPCRPCRCSLSGQTGQRLRSGFLSPPGLDRPGFGEPLDLQVQLHEHELLCPLALAVPNLHASQRGHDPRQVENTR